jgi:hypothetical protein
VTEIGSHQIGVRQWPLDRRDMARILRKSGLISARSAQSPEIYVGRFGGVSSADRKAPNRSSV